MAPLTADELLSYNPTIQIETHIGPLCLQTHLSLEDLDALAEPARSGLSDRDFVALLLTRVIRRPSLSQTEISEWDDETLALVALTWAENENSDLAIDPDAPLLTALRNGFVDLYRRTVELRNRRTAAAWSSLSPPLRVPIPKVYVPLLPKGYVEAITRAAQLVKPVDRSILDAVKIAQQVASHRLFSELARWNTHIISDYSRLIMSLSPVLSAADISVARIGELFADSARQWFDALPDIGAMVAERLALDAQQLDWFIRQIRAGEVFEETGYPILSDYADSKHVAIALAVDDVDPKVRSAVMTNRLLAVTKATPFRESLAHSFAATSLLHRRWRIVEPALDAHRKREYTLAIPALFAQVEGMFVDVLILRGSVIREGGKLWAVSGGQKRHNRKGEPIELHGLRQAIQNSDLTESPLIEPMAHALMDHLFADRNDVMHGRKTDYDKAKTSVSLVLVAAILAALFSHLEAP